MLKVEFHCHTLYSKDSLTRLQDLIQTARRKGLDRVIITDHNTIAGALAARSLAPELIIVGEEIMTTRGEILAAFVSEAIPRGLTPLETIQRLRDQGAFISVSHPFDLYRGGHWDLPDLKEIIPHVDALETFNARCMVGRFNDQARTFALANGIPGTVGSDAHVTFELGRATLSLPSFSSGAELRAIIKEGLPQTRLSSPFVHLTSRYATVMKKWKIWLDTLFQA